MRFFFVAQTLLSSITLDKRFRTKFTYDYNLCIIHALNIISIATHHHRLNFEFLVGCFAVGKLRVERKLHVVLAPIVNNFLYLQHLLNQILFFSRGEIGQMTHPSLFGSFPSQRISNQEQFVEPQQDSRTALVYSSIFYCINSVHLSHIHRHFIVFEFYNRMIVY